MKLAKKIIETHKVDEAVDVRASKLFDLANKLSNDLNDFNTEVKLFKEKNKDLLTFGSLESFFSTFAEKAKDAKEPIGRIMKNAKTFSGDLKRADKEKEKWDKKK